MNKANNFIQKIIIAFFLLPLFNFFCTPTQCSSNQTTISFKYPCLKQPVDTDLDQKRKVLDEQKIDCLEIISKTFPISTLYYTEPRDSRPGTCYNSALKKTLLLTETQWAIVQKKIAGGEDWIDILKAPYDYFDEQQSYDSNLLVTYTHDADPFYIHHMAVTTTNQQCLSKIGGSDYTIQHYLWEIFASYGNNIRFWKLKAMYASNQGKISLFQSLLTKINNSHAMHNILINHTKDFIKNVTNNNYGESYRLIKRITGLNIDAYDNDGQTTALMHTIHTNNLKIALMLLNHGADLNQQNRYGHSAFSLAVAKGDSDFIREFINYGAFINQQNHTNGNTPLIIAARHENFTACELLLLNNGMPNPHINPNLKDINGNTALIAALTTNNIPLAVLLKQCGANLDEKYYQEEDTPLILATKKGHTHWIETLSRLGADINKQNKHGDTPLIIATKTYNLQSIKDIIKCKAKTDLRNNEQHTALDIATKNGAQHIINYLKNLSSNQLSIEPYKPNSF